MSAQVMSLAQISVRVAVICAMTTASESSTRLSASGEPHKENPDDADDDEEPIQITNETWSEVVQDLEELAQNKLDPANGLSEEEEVESLQCIADLALIPYEVVVHNWQQVLERVKEELQSECGSCQDAGRIDIDNPVMTALASLDPDCLALLCSIPHEQLVAGVQATAEAGFRQFFGMSCSST